MPFTLTTVMIVSSILFCFGVYTVLARRNAICILMGIELMMNAAGLNFVAFTRFMPPQNMPQPLAGHAFTLFIIAVAASEVAVALAIVLSLHQRAKTIDVQQFNQLQG